MVDHPEGGTGGDEARLWLTTEVGVAGLKGREGEGEDVLEGHARRRMSSSM